jgi:hypothetical protein
MPLFSRERLVWEAPGATLDGDAIDPSTLAYELGIGPVGNPGEMQSLMSLPGTLTNEVPGPNGGQVFEAPLDQSAIGLGDYDVAVRAINPAGGNPSAWSNALALSVAANPTPAAPVLLDL